MFFDVSVISGRRSCVYFRLIFHTDVQGPGEHRLSDVFTVKSEGDMVSVSVATRSTALLAWHTSSHTGFLGLPTDWSIITFFTSAGFFISPLSATDFNAKRN